MIRLKTRPQFQAVLAGQIVAKTPHFVLHRTGLDAQVPCSVKTIAVVSTSEKKPVRHALFEPIGTWVGAMVPKRWAKRAVTRNTIKRQIYSVSACYALHLCREAYVVRLRKSFDRSSFFSASSEQLKLTVRHELESLFASLQKA